jgi:hypothetical protein
MRDLRHTYVGIGQQRFGYLNVVIGQFRRAAARPARAPRGGEARSGALPDQAIIPPTQSSAPIHPFRRYTTFIAAALCRGSLAELRRS